MESFAPLTSLAKIKEILHTNYAFLLDKILSLINIIIIQ